MQDVTMAKSDIRGGISIASGLPDATRYYLGYARINFNVPMVMEIREELSGHQLYVGRFYRTDVSFEISVFACYDDGLMKIIFFFQKETCFNNGQQGIALNLISGR